MLLTSEVLLTYEVDAWSLELCLTDFIISKSVFKVHSWRPGVQRLHWPCQRRPGLWRAARRCRFSAPIINRATMRRLFHTQRRPYRESVAILAPTAHDNVASVNGAGWAGAFRATAVLLAVMEGFACGWSLWILRRSMVQRSSLELLK